ncbi:Ser/Thr protein phosphatase [Histomonas meleagridis]|uniref:Ser/Thr protein phosphatase n=1 Tax=Histomonas meleagridis TaxID=135588 RepID=UPI003559A6C4|nr:Ser/Thr protein phosphatase [Histomonas meleagridis]KAH0806447.1 Ser/Thr protein phosphatase [Histomonas meleagridis]
MKSEEIEFDQIFSTIEEGNHLSELTVVKLMKVLQEILYQEPNCLELQTPITICGDIHGQLFDLLQLFETAGRATDDNNKKFLFLGDYVDRGYFSLETFVYLATLKIKYPNRIFLLRGNHESRQLNTSYGFYNDCLQIYGHIGVWSLCNEIFDLLPISAIIDKRVFCVHGGLSRELPLIEHIDLLQRRMELPFEGPLSDLCWSDPDNVRDWTKSQRGAGYIFGYAQVEQFLRVNRLQLIVRSHQLAQEGYKYFFDQKLITVWSAPNYMYRSGNKACVMELDANLSPNLKQFSTHPKSDTKPNDVVSPYFA